MVIFKHRLQEAAVEKGGGGGGAAVVNNGAAANDWRAPFGAESTDALKPFEKPADFLKAFNERSTELTALKAKPAAFDWRKELGGEDQDAQKLLNRYTDPKAFYKAHTEAVGKIRSGELKQPLDMAKATPEQITEYRTANGIPLEAKDYWTGLPNGLVIGKEDQGVFDAYGAIFHKHNVPPAFAHEVAKLYYEQQDAITKAERQLDDGQKLKTTQELRTLWGQDYDANEAIVGTWLDALGKENKQMLMDAVLPDGSRLWNNRAMRTFLVEQARQINPLAHVLPGASEGALMSLESEIATLKGLMANQGSEYWKGPKAEKNQARYKQLIEAQSKLQKK